MHTQYFRVAKTDTIEARNWEIRMKTTIHIYPQNQEEFIQQNGDKLHKFSCDVTAIGICDVMNT